MNQVDITSRIHSAALKLLARREHSQFELQQKLAQRFPSSEHAISNVLRRLLEEGYQSDGRFAEAYTRSRLNRGYGPQRLRQELLLRGISAEDAEIALTQVISSEECPPQLREVWRKKFNFRPKDAREKFQQIRFLRYRGFTAREIDALFVQLDENTDKL